MWGRRTYTPQFGRRLAELMAAVKTEPVSERPLLYKSEYAAPAHYALLFLYSMLLLLLWVYVPTAGG